MDLEPFLYWCQERESIRRLRAAGAPPPWTKDPILQEFRFCNVRREDDRVTIWVREHIREPYADHPNLWLMLCIARFINWPPTLQALMDRGAWPVVNYDENRVVAVLDDLTAQGSKVWTGAYLIKGDSGARPAAERRKPFYVGKTVLGETWHRRHAVAAYLPHGLAATHRVLSGIYGWGPFLAYQAVVDMRFTPLLAGASDRASWAAAGPGTIRGLNRLHERRLDFPLTQERASAELAALYPLLQQVVELDFTDTPNVCCEVDKMLRARNGEGRPKARYSSQGGAY
jgi:hypothetical protein